MLLVERDVLLAGQKPLDLRRQAHEFLQRSSQPSLPRLVRAATPSPGRFPAAARCPGTPDRCPSPTELYPEPSAECAEAPPQDVQIEPQGLVVDVPDVEGEPVAPRDVRGSITWGHPEMPGSTECRRRCSAV